MNINSTTDAAEIEELARQLQREKNREYYRKNRERILKKQREMRSNNIETALEKEREYRTNNPEKVKKWREDYWKRKAEEKLNKEA